MRNAPAAYFVAVSEQRDHEPRRYEWQAEILTALHAAGANTPGGGR
jgi:hypothetical protein